MEQPFVTAVTHSDAEARVTLIGVRDEPGVAGRIFTALADANVNVDVIIQNEPVGDDQLADLSFTVDRDDLPTATDTIAAPRRVSPRSAPTSRSARSRSSAPACAPIPASPPRSSRSSASERINIEMISTSPIKISCVIPADRVPDAVRPCTGRSSSAPTGSSPRTRPARPPADGRRLSPPSTRAMAGDGYRVGVLGATGRSARRSSRCSPSASSRPPRSSPLASERSAGKEIELNGAALELPRARARSRSRASTSSSPRPAARSAPSGRRRSSRPARSSSTTPATGACTTTCRWSSPRSTRRRSRATAGSSPTPTARPCRWSSRWRRSIARPGSSASSSPPTRRSPAPARRRSRSCSTQSRAVLARRRTPSGRDLPAPDRLQRARPGGSFADGDDYTDRGAQADDRDPQDPRRRRRAGSAPPASACPSSPATPSRSTSRPASRSSPERARELLAAAPGVDRRRRAGRGPLPDGDRGRRPRRGPGRPHPPRPRQRARLNLWIVADNLRKGAATNAVQLAELLVERGLLST